MLNLDAQPSSEVDVCFIHPEVKSAYQRGIYLYARSLLAALHLAKQKVTLLTDVASSLSADALRREICQQIAHPPRIKVRSLQVLPEAIRHRMGWSSSKYVPLAANGSYSEANDFLIYIRGILNAPQFYEMCRLAASKPFISPIDIDFVREHKHQVCLTTAPLAIQSRTRSVKIVQTVHDLIVLNTNAHNVNVGKFKRRLDAAMKHADMVLAVSEFTKQEVLDRYPALKDRVRVVYQPLPATDDLIEASNCLDTIRSTLTRHGLAHGKYVFFVGAIEERKNIANLIKAFETSKIRDDVKLVFAGMLDESYLAREGVLHHFKNADGSLTGSSGHGFVRYLGRVSELEKLCLLRAAMFFAFPTITEGFGIPILEAQAMGCPVMTTNSSAIPEVAGNTALLIEDPSDVDEISAAISQLGTDANLRAHLSASGLTNSARFSKSSFSEALARVIEDVQG